MKKSQRLLSITTWVSGAFMLGLVIAGFLIVQFSRELPNAQSIKGIELKVPLRVYSADHLLISEFGNERRKPISYPDTPQKLIDAVLASEDDGFFEHGGVDFKGLFRAALSNFRSGSSGQGASTITMQVARNFFLSRDKTYERKLKEVLLSFRLEQILSKEEILSLYLNKIFLGNRAYGFAAAAEVYYEKELTELSTAEIAMLAGLPKAPSTFNPLRNPERALVRRNYVLGRLHELGKIDQDHYQSSLAQPVTAERHGRQPDLVAPHIAEMVRAQLTEQYGEKAYWQGLNVYTTILSRQQIAASASLRRGLQAYDRRHGFRGVVGTVNLESIAELSASEAAGSGYLDSLYEAALQPYPSSQEQVPAIVLEVAEQNARLWARDFGAVNIELSTAKWAKRHKTANLVGARPKKMSELMAAGDIIFIQPQESEADNDAAQAITGDALQPAAGWKLSQIPNVSGALISVEPKSGKILSLVGGYDFFLNKYNRATQSIRQPGSNIKPFIYSASLDQGFTPASLISGSSIVIRDTSHGTLWRPENYSGKFYGPTRMREALSKSMNLVSIRLLRAIGIPYARQYLDRFGIDMNRFSASLTMALGSGGVKPIEMLSAYSILANGGYKVQPYFIERITDRDGKPIFVAPTPEPCDQCYVTYLSKPEDLVDPDADPASGQPDSAGEMEATNEQPLPAEPQQQPIDLSIPRLYEAPRVMSHSNNFLTVSMMKDVIRRGTARKAQALNRQDLAGKTGTTNDYIDAWFTGFNSKVATTVWVGFDNPSTMGRGESGSLTALPIWVDYMRTELNGVPEDSTKLPEYIESGFIDRDTGRRTDELEPNAIQEYFKIEELTPEYALLQNLYADSSIELDIDAADINAPESVKGDLNDILEEEEGDAEQAPSELRQQDRIIEDREDTEGLF
ncbi:MAG: penicillin-binding protein 1A [Arenicella sp.]|nr:penicillin-binding protein 1A [Arenicella sp.]